MFNDCPAEVKKTIFARVRHMDLYEVGRVSQEWWTLTMATCRPTSAKYTPFWKFQLEFYNQMMPKEEGWKPWMFIEFTDDKTIELFGPPDEKMVEYLRRKDIPVRKLIYKGDCSILPKLKELFPHLQTLDFTLDSYKYDGEAVGLPDGLTHLRLAIIDIHLRSQSLNVFKHFERVNSLHIFSRMRIFVGNIRFDNLKHLVLNMSENSTQDLKSLVNSSKQLSSVHLLYGEIDKEWLGLFPTNIQKIHLARMRLAKANPPLLETVDGLVERELMVFVCQDWTKIRIFKSSNLSIDYSYSATYICRPLVHEEEREIQLFTDRIHRRLLKSGELQLKALKLREWQNAKRDLVFFVPDSVQHFEWSAIQFEAIDFALLFEDISTIKTLRFDSIWNKHLQLNVFSRAVNLVSLDITVVNEVMLASIFRNCPYLKQLSLKCSQGMPFSQLPTKLKSSSVKELTIVAPKDSIANILGHFPCLVDLQLQNINMETVTTADLATLESVGFVRIIFVNVNALDVLIQMVNGLDNLSFSQLVLGYSRDYFDKRLSCVMGTENAFFRRYLSSNSINDFTKMNVRQLEDCFRYRSLFHVKGVSNLHLSSWSKDVQISYDLREFIAKAST